MLVADDGHVTTLAVDPAWHRHKLGTRLLHTLATRGDRPGRQEPHARGAGQQRRRPGALPRLRVRAGRDPQGLLRRDQGGRHRDVGQRRRHAPTTRDRLAELAAGVPGAPPSSRSSTDVTRRAHPRHRDVVRRDGGGHRRAGHVGAVVGRQQPGRPARPLRRRRARDRQPGPRRPHRPGGRAGVRRGRALGPPGRRRRLRGRRRRRHLRPGPRRRPARRRVGGQGARARVGRAVHRRQPPRGAPLRHVPRGARPRAPARGAARVGRPHAARAHGGPRAVPGARLHHRRRRRRGLRQGRPLPRPRLPGRAGHRPAGGRRATPRRSGSRGRCSATAPTTSPSAG